MGDNDSDVSALTLSDEEVAPTRAPQGLLPARGKGKAKDAKRAGRHRDLDEEEDYDDGRAGGRRGQGGSTKPKRRVGFADEVQVMGGGRRRHTRDDDYEEEEEQDDDDVSLLDEGFDDDAEGDEGDEEAGDGRMRDESKPLGYSYFHKHDGEGPVTWDQVDERELGFVAESLVTSATVRAASQAEEVMQQIFQAGPSMQDTAVSDPLGRGYIDLDSMSLGKKPKQAKVISLSGGDKGLKATMRTFRTARLGARGGEAAAAGGSGQEGQEARAATAAVDEESRKLLPNQEGFDAETYLATFHSDSSMPQLEKGLKQLSKELSERTGQLRQLIRNNFDRFINCKDAIDDIHSKLRKMLVSGAPSGGGAGGRQAAAAQQQQAVGADRVYKSLEQVQADAARTLGPVLERAAQAERLRSVTGLLERFHGLFAAPGRIMELAAKGELEQVVRDYKRANALIRPTATSARVWVSLYTEIERRLTEVYTAVKQLVADPPPEPVPMGRDGPTVLFGVVDAPRAASTGRSRGSHTSGAGGAEGDEPSRRGRGSERAAAGGGGGGGGGGAGQAAGAGADDPYQQRMRQLPDYLLFMALVRQERLPAARDDEPMRFYVSSMEQAAVRRIAECDNQHTEQLQQLVTAWMHATGTGGRADGSGSGAPGAAASAPSAGAGPSGTGGAAGPGALQVPSTGLGGAVPSPRRSLHSSLSMVRIRDPSGGAAAGQQGGGLPQVEEEEEEEVDEVERVEEAEEAFLLWQGPAAGAAAVEPPALPHHLRIELRRLVQDPGGMGGGHGEHGGLGGPGLRGLGSGAAGGAGGGGKGSAGASARLAAAGMEGDGLGGARAGAGAGESGPAGEGLLPLPTSAHAPDPLLTPAQRQWVQYVSCVSWALLWVVPGLWATCHSARYGNSGELEAGSGGREELDRGPGLARKLVELLCAKYAARLRRAAKSLARAGPMQPGLPLIIQDACHLWTCLGRVGVSRKALNALRGGALAVLADHVRVLGEHLGELPEALFAADDFRLDLLAADQQPVTVLPRRLEEELGIALLHYQWPLRAVAQAAGGAEEVPADDTWRPMQTSVLDCFQLLSEALAEYGRSLYDTAAAGEAAPKLHTVASGLSLGSAPSLPISGMPLLPPGAAGPDPSAHGRANAGLLHALRGSSDVRVLLVISNSAVIRTRVMPGVVERYRRLLAPTPEAVSSSQRRVRELTTAMRRSNEALGSSYLTRKEAEVQRAVAAYIAAETAPLLAAAAAAVPLPAGAAAAAAAGAKKTAFALPGVVDAGGAGGALLQGPCAPSPGCVALLQLMTTIHNEALAYSPSNVRSFMEALAEFLVEELLDAYEALAASGGSGTGAGGGGAEGGPQGSVEQLVQLAGDLAFLSGAVRPLLPAELAVQVEDAQVVLGSAIVSRQRVRRYTPASAPAAELAGCADGRAASARLLRLLRPRVQGWLQRYALNVRCFVASSGGRAAGAGAGNGVGRAGGGGGGDGGSGAVGAEEAGRGGMGERREEASLTAAGSSSAVGRRAVGGSKGSSAGPGGSQPLQQQAAAASPPEPAPKTRLRRPPGAVEEPASASPPLDAPPSRGAGRSLRRGPQ